MQLNSPNGNVIRLNKIDINQNRVVYSKYDFGNGKLLEQKALVFSTIDLKDYLTIEIVYETLCYNTIVTEQEPSFVLDEEVQNWLFPATNVRIYIPALTYNAIVNSGNDLDSLVTQYIASDWIALSEGIHYYRDTLPDIERDILELYENIVIEDKI